jgi:hypothetical protein
MNVLGVSPVSDIALNDAMENVYTSLKAGNTDLDSHIAALRAAMARDGLKEAAFDPARIAQNNRQGRKLMQSYFRKRGVAVTFTS